MADQPITVYKPGDPIGCPKCKRKLYETYTQACFVFETDLEDVIRKCSKKERRKLIKRFLVMVNTLLNEGGGVIHVHTKPELLGFWDEQIDDELMELVPDDTLFEENFERHFIDDDLNHVTFRVKPRDRPASTLDFKSKVSLNKGLMPPTHFQMRRLLRPADRPADPDVDPPPPRLPHPLRKGQPVQIYERVDVQAKVAMEKKFEKPKETPRVERLMNYWWEELKLSGYITAFCKQTRGGSFYLGLREEKVLLGPRWIPIPGSDCLPTIFGAEEGTMFWRDDNDDKVFHVATEEHVPAKEHAKSGHFICEGVLLSEREKVTLEREILNRADRCLLWKAVTTVPGMPPAIVVQNQVEVHFHPVSDTEANNNVSLYQEGGGGEVEGAVGGFETNDGDRHRRASEEDRQRRASGEVSAGSKGEAIPKQNFFSRRKGKQLSDRNIASTTSDKGHSDNTNKKRALTTTSDTSGSSSNTAEDVDRQLYVIEVAVKYFPGVCFQESDGPEAYKFDRRDKPRQTEKMNYEKWNENMQCVAVQA